MSKATETVDVQLVYKRDTAKAFMVEDPNGKKKDAVLFLPMSLVKRDGHIFTMPRWLAEDKGIENCVVE